MRSEENPPLFGVDGSSHKGRIREVNEDAWWAAVFPPGSRNPLGIDAVAVVADGMGGHEAGEYASSYAVRLVQETCTGERNESLGDVPIEDVSSRIIESVNAGLYDRAERFSDSHPGTTITLALLRGSSFCLGHVGDSRAYLVSGDKAEQLTEDHTWAAEQIRQGLMSEEEAAVSDLRSQLIQAVGTRSSVTVYQRIGRIGPGQAMVLCTDGLYDHLNPSDIAGVCQLGRTDLETARSLVDLALDRGGEDNITAVLLKPTSSANTPTMVLRLPEVQKRFGRKQRKVGMLIVGVITVAVFVLVLTLFVR